MISRSASAGCFPPETYEEIRRMPGNDKCCDCSSLDTDWGSINHGTLICLECAGKHRGLGVTVSFIRSIHMDTWTPNQVEMMRQGGNQQMRDFFRKLEIHNSPIVTLYNTKGASHYRDHLKDRVDKILRGEISSHRKIIPTTTSSSDKSPSTRPPTINVGSAVSNGSNGNASSVATAEKTDKAEKYHVKFTEGSMGMTITKDWKGGAVISKLVPGGLASSSGVLVGDTIIGVAGKALIDYDEIMHMIPCMSRPLVIQFCRPAAATPASSGSKSNQLTNSHTKITPRSLSREIFHESGSAKKQTSGADRSVSNTTSPAGIAASSNNSLSKKETPTKNGSTSSKKNNKSQLKSCSSDIEDNGTLSKNVLKGQKKLLKSSELKKLNRLQEDTTTAEYANLPSPDAESEHLHTEDSVSGCAVLADADKAGEGVNEGIEVLAISKDTGGSLINDAKGQRDDDEDDVEDDVEDDDDDDDDEEEEEEEDDDDEEEDKNDEDDSDDEEEEEEEEVETEEIYMQLREGDVIKVERKGKPRSAIVIRQHRDGSYKVSFRDGSTESNVTMGRISITQDIIDRCTSLADDKTQQALRESGSPTIMSAAMYNNSSYTNAASNNSLQAMNEGEEEFIVQNSDSLDMDDWINDDSEGKVHRVKKHLGKHSSSSSSDTNSNIGSISHGHSSAVNEYVDVEDAPSDSHDFRVTFEAPPLGITLSKGFTGCAEVTKVKVLGIAEKAGVVSGDMLIGISTYPVRTYDEAMGLLPYVSYPVVLVFRRGMMSKLAKTSESVVKGSQFIATKVLQGLGMGKQGILKAPPAQKLSNKNSNKQSSTDDGSTATSDGKNSKRMSTKKELALSPDASTKEFDVLFQEGDLGFRLEERDGFKQTTVVTNITEGGQAHRSGVKLNCIVVGVNGEQFLSHAHTVTTLKHARRPVVVRFRYNN